MLFHFTLLLASEAGPALNNLIAKGDFLLSAIRSWYHGEASMSFIQSHSGHSEGIVPPTGP